MTPIQRAPLRAALLAAVMLAAFQLSSGAPSVQAGGTSFFVAYGRGLEPGASVGVIVGGKLCGTVEAGAGGEWVATVGPSAPEFVCAAVAGDIIQFKLNGVLTGVTEVYKNGGTPAEPQFGVVLNSGDAGSGVDTVPPVIEGPELVDGRLDDGQELAKIDFNLEFAAFDAVDGEVDLFTSAPADGFPLGKTTVTVWAVDTAGNKTIREVLVLIVGDTIPPKIYGPEIIERVVATEGALAEVDLSDFSAIDETDGAVDLLNDAPDAGFPVGKTFIRFTAVDAAGNEAVLETKVIVTVKYSGDAGIAGDVPVEGIGFGNAVGGPVSVFRTALLEQGVKSVWIIHEGRFVIFYPAAPDFVSAFFLDLFGDGIPEGEPMLVWAN